MTVYFINSVTISYQKLQEKMNKFDFNVCSRLKSTEYCVESFHPQVGYAYHFDFASFIQLYMLELNEMQVRYDTRSD